MFVSLRFKVYNFASFLFDNTSRYGLTLIGALGISLANLLSNETIGCNQVILSSAIGRLSYF